MAMQRRNYQAIDGEGATIPSPVVDVFVSGTLTRADLFSDDLPSPTPLANPLTGDSDGRFGFYTPDGLVDIVVDSAYTLEAEQFDSTLALVDLGSVITSINGDTTAAQTIEIDDAGVDAAISTGAGVTTISLPTASGAARGLLHPSHWTYFAGKMDEINGLTATAQSMVSGTTGTDFNITNNGSSIHTFNLPTASASSRGALSSTDWSTFNGKQNAFAGTTLQYVRGDASLATLNTAIVPESGNLYHTTARARLTISATAPVSYNNSTGVISMAAATGAVNGYLTAANFTTFNNKLGTLNTLTGATQTFAVGTSGTDFAISSVGTTHTFNIPNASASARGLVSTGSQTIAGAKTFSSPITEVKDVDSLVVDGTRYVRNTTTTVDTTLAETDLTTITLAGAPSVDRTYRIRAGGDVRVGTGGTDTVRYKVYIGGSVVWDSGALDLTDTTALPYQLDVDLTVRTAGAAGVVQAGGRLAIQDSVVATSQIIKNTNTTAITLTGTPILKTTVTFSASDATNQINERTTVIQTLN